MKPVYRSDLEKEWKPIPNALEMIDFDEKETITTHYNYLLNMSISQFTQDKIDELAKQINDKETEYTTLENTNIKDMWIQELDLLEKDCKRII